MIGRLHRRWASIRAFAATGQTLPDRLALGVAGFARHRPFGDNSAYARLGRLLFQDIRPRVAAAKGLQLQLDLTDFVDLMIYEEIFVEGIYPLERTPFQPDLVVDCGACRGMFTLLACARFPSARCIAFEPEPKNFSRLQANLGFNPARVEAVRAAVGIEAGRIRFTGDGFGGHTLAAAETGGIEVEVVSLPDVLRRAAPARLVLKIDIEGAERELLPALADCVPADTVIYVETHHPEPVCATYLQPLLAAGFRHEIIRHREGAPDNAGRFVERLLVRQGKPSSGK